MILVLWRIIDNNDLSNINTEMQMMSGITDIRKRYCALYYMTNHMNSARECLTT